MTQPKDGWQVDRKQPYTENGINRARCLRCGAPARYQWSICSDGNRHRPVCASCDIGLNRAALEYMRHPNVEKLIADYSERLGKEKPTC